MIPKTLLLAALGCLFLASDSRAAWLLQHLPPQIEELEDGLVRFTAVRVRPADDDRLHRSNRLTLSDGETVLLETELPEESDKQGRLVYRFKVRRDRLDGVVFQIHEKETERLHIVGGGTIYEYAMKPSWIDAAVESSDDAPDLEPYRLGPPPSEGK